MGDPNQLAYVSRLLHQLDGPILEVGSRDYGSTQNLRPLFQGKGEYVGVDLFEGPGVDCILDLTADFAEVDRALGGKRFGTIVCFSVLEHCDHPFRMAENLTRLLKPGGKICISAPFAWKFHGYPSDYWRFTHEGIKRLFSEIHFHEAACCSATSRTGEFEPLDADLGKRSLSGKTHRGAGHPLRRLTALVLRLMGKFGPLGWFTRYRYLLVPTNVLMVGQFLPVATSRTTDGRHPERNRQSVSPDDAVFSGSAMERG